MLRSSILAASLAIGLAQTAAAQPVILYSANFNSPTYTDGPLVNPPTATDTTTPGQDGWLSTSAGLTNQIQVSNTATNGLVSLGAAGGQDVRRLFNGAATVTSGSVYYDADVTVTSAAATGDYALHFSDGGTSNFYARAHFKSSGTGFVMGLSTSSVGT